MRLLFVADGRSPIALNWIEYFLESNHEVHLASTYPCPTDGRLASLHLVPVAFSGLKSAGERQASGKGVGGSLFGASALRARTLLRQWLGPLTLPRAARSLRQVFARLEPDLVHAQRIPYEGMLAAFAQPAAPLLISVWGNDFTLHAPATPLTSRYTRLVLQRADALHADCQRDIRLARAWGFSEDKPTIVLPGAGGVQPELFYPPGAAEGSEDRNAGGESAVRELTVINPRGFRAYVRNDTFFQAIPLVMARQPRARFLCPAMAGDPQALRWLETLGLGSSVELLPRQTRSQMAALFRRSQVAVSPSTHDGTPNTLLEAMACGCVPVVGDIESLREWILPGVNGLLVDPTDPQALARAILEALESRELSLRAREHNARLIAERASYGRVMEQAESFYQQLV